ncbi:MAG: putative signal transducing protein [Acidobacteriota bacterium]
MVEHDPPVHLLTTWNDSEAEMVRELLASYGIRCSVSSEVPHSILPLNVDGLGAIRLHVPAQAEEEARRILAAHRAAGRDPREERSKGMVVPMPVTVRAATRIDLAGGTLDIWPLYLFLDAPVTVNLAIDLPAVAEASLLSGSRVEIASDDLGQSVQAGCPLDLDLAGELPLACRLVRVMAPEGGLRLRTAASVPAGSGMGGSSALAVAMAVAVRTLKGKPPQRRDLPSLTRLLANVEAQVLGIPTGVQDYYPPLLGGCQALFFSARGVEPRPIPVSNALLEERLVLAYEGGSRSSGLSNLDMLRRYLGGEEKVRAGLTQVARAAGQMHAALTAGDMEAAAHAMAREMAARRQLSPQVMTQATRRLFAAARSVGAAAKVCGAGGGGCSVYWSAAGRREDLVAALEKAGGRVLPFRIAPHGLLSEGQFQP